MNPSVEEYIETNRDRFLDELFELLSIPSISTDAEYAGDVRRGADWLVDHLESIGVDTVELHTFDEGHPLVYAEHGASDADAPTLLVYGHYDVQPPDPLGEWKSPPFEPEVRDEKIFARGATDDKGQFFAHLKGIESWLEADGDLPVNVKLVIEGEEEIGSPRLAKFVPEHPQKLACDAVVISDSSMIAPGVPTITYSLRGLTYMEVTVTAAGHDLHSGLYGGAVINPINELSRIVAELHDETGRIDVPGFYDEVRPIDSEQREALSELPFDEEGFRLEAGAKELSGEREYSTLERIWLRPTLDCNGIWGGYTGEGAKTVLPAKAHAKISCRLVPDQDHGRIGELVEERIRQLADDAVEVDVSFHHGGPPVVVERDAPAVNAASRALEEVWGRPAVFKGSGGSIPVVSTFAKVLEVPTVLMGFGLEDDRLHSPNEKFNVENFYAGIRASAHLWDQTKAL